MHKSRDDTASALCDFLLQIRSDSEAGSVRCLSDYLARFPEFEVEIAREYLAFVGGTEAQQLEIDVAPDADAALLERLSTPRRAIERYEVGAELGRGGMATVRRAQDLELDRELAIKIIARGGSFARRRFLAEARVTGRLDHPGIVPVHELGIDDDGRLFFTMRLIEGIDFERAIERVHAGDRDWTLSRALEVLIKVCDTLAFAHARGIVHRDLKPSNVMTGRYGEAYVVDWGLAHARSIDGLAHSRAMGETTGSFEDIEATPFPMGSSEPSADMTRDGDVLGTPYYMSPEQATGRAGIVDARSDVYAAGAILYQLLANRRPYSEPKRQVSLREALARVTAGPPESLRKLRRDAPLELVAISEKAMQREPDRRYSTMDDMGRDLRAFLERRVVTAYATGRWARARKWIARNRALSVVCWVALGIALIAAAVILQQHSVARSRLEYVYGAQLATSFENLWPPRLESVPVVERWLADVHKYLATNEQNRASLADLKRRARLMDPSRPAERKRRAEMDDRQRRAVKWLARLHEMQRDLDAGKNRLTEGLTPARLRADIELYEREVSEAPQQPTPQLTYEFDNADDQLLYDALSRVVQDQDVFAGGESHLSLIHLAEWGLSASRRVEQQSLIDARSRWDESIASIAEQEPCSPYYDPNSPSSGLHLAPQLGLVPIGRDPASGLWEFAHAASGEVPTRGRDGRLELREDSAIVLVLIPGGTLLRGSQRDRPRDLNFDRWAESNAPCGDHANLEPFFLAKHEMTQAQWLRIAGWNPSFYVPSSHREFASPNADTRFAVNGMHPVEGVSFTDAALVTRVMGLTLPTEAQWEWAARAGSTAPWWSGTTPADAHATENFADVRAAIWETAPTSETVLGIEFDDGWPVHAPIGSFAPNAFGLHDMLGNVSEWCRDEGSFSYTDAIRVFTGERAGTGDGTRAVRGGSFYLASIHGRSASRQQFGQEWKWYDLGLRVAREIDR